MNLVIYGKANCPWCDKAKDLAEFYDIRYDYKDVGKKDILEEMKFLVPGAKTVPQILIDSIAIGGYQEFKEYLEH